MFASFNKYLTAPTKVKQMDLFIYLFFNNFQALSGQSRDSLKHILSIFAYFSSRK